MAGTESSTKPSYTALVRCVFDAACDEARAQGQGSVTGEHLLLGLTTTPGLARTLLAEAGITVDEVRASTSATSRVTDAEALAEIGIDLEAVQERIEEVFGAGALQGSGRGLTELALNALELAAEEATGLGHDFVGTEHVLLGLTRQEEGVTAAFLARFGLDLPSLRETVAQRLRALIGLRQAVDATAEFADLHELFAWFRETSERDQGAARPAMDELWRATMSAWGDVIERGGKDADEDVVARYRTTLSASLASARAELACADLHP